MIRKSIMILSGIIACLLITVNTNTLMAQSDQIQGSSSAVGDLYQERGDIGVGSVDNPNARIHIFNGNTNLLDPQARNKRPFLITGFNKVFVGNSPTTGNPVYYNEPKDYFTVDKQGYVGIDYLKPLTKL